VVFRQLVEVEFHRTEIPEENETMSPEEAKPPESLYAGLPQFPGGSDLPELSKCLECQRCSPYVRTYSLPWVAFLLVFFIWWEDRLHKCPGCLRRHILLYAPLCVLLGNALSPFLLLWWFVLFLSTFFIRAR
jgi:hypothetical protein